MKKTKKLLLIAACTMALCTTKTLVAQQMVKGYYDTLFIAGDDLLKAETDKYVFLPTVSNEMRLFMEGWSASGLWGTGFKNGPKIKLELGEKSNIEFGPGSRFSDYVVHRKTIRKAKKEIKKYKKANEPAYLLFVPAMVADDDVEEDTLFVYHLVISNRNPKKTGDQQQMRRKVETNLNMDANPSPPRSFSKLEQ